MRKRALGDSACRLVLLVDAKRQFRRPLLGRKADVLFLRNVRGQVAVLGFVDRGRNNSEILPEDTAEM